MTHTFPPSERLHLPIAGFGVGAGGPAVVVMIGVVVVSGAGVVIGAAVVVVVVVDVDVEGAAVVVGAIVVVVVVVVVPSVELEVIGC